MTPPDTPAPIILRKGPLDGLETTAGAQAGAVVIDGHRYEADTSRANMMRAAEGLALIFEHRPAD
jgi:hypothetical protein